MFALRIGLLLALGLTLALAEDEVIKCPGGECVKLHLCRDGEIVTDGSNLIDIRFNPDDPCEHYLLKCCKVAGNIDDSEQIIAPPPSNGEFSPVPPSSGDLIQPGAQDRDGSPSGSGGPGLGGLGSGGSGSGGPGLGGAGSGGSGSSGPGAGEVGAGGPGSWTGDSGNYHAGHQQHGGGYYSGSFSSAYTHSSSSSSHNSSSSSSSFTHNYMQTGQHGSHTSGSNTGSNVGGAHTGRPNTSGQYGSQTGSTNSWLTHGSNTHGNSQQGTFGQNQNTMQGTFQTGQGQIASGTGMSSGQQTTMSQGASQTAGTLQSSTNHGTYQSGSSSSGDSKGSSQGQHGSNQAGGHGSTHTGSFYAPGSTNAPYASGQNGPTTRPSSGSLHGSTGHTTQKPGSFTAGGSTQSSFDQTGLSSGHGSTGHSTQQSGSQIGGGSTHSSFNLTGLSSGHGSTGHSTQQSGSQTAGGSTQSSFDQSGLSSGHGSVGHSTQQSASQTAGGSTQSSFDQTGLSSGHGSAGHSTQQSGSQTAGGSTQSSFDQTGLSSGHGSTGHSTQHSGSQIGGGSTLSSFNQTGLSFGHGSTGHSTQQSGSQIGGGFTHSSFNQTGLSSGHGSTGHSTQQSGSQTAGGSTQSSIDQTGLSSGHGSTGHSTQQSGSQIGGGSTHSSFNQTGLSSGHGSTGHSTHHGSSGHGSSDPGSFGQGGSGGSSHDLTGANLVAGDLYSPGHGGNTVVSKPTGTILPGVSTVTKDQTKDTHVGTSSGSVKQEHISSNQQTASIGSQQNNIGHVHHSSDGCKFHTEKHAQGHLPGHSHYPIDHTTVSPIKAPHENVGCGFRNKDGVGFRITGNQDGESEYGEFPWMVAILREEKALDQVINVYQCGGSLIHPQVVLTAAHCIQNKKPNEIKVRLGEWDTQTTNEIHDHQDRNVLDIVFHEQFYKGGLFNDIGLLFLDKPVDIVETVNTICLPPQDYNFDLSRCFASGWGKDVFGKEGKYQVILKKIELPIMPFNQCQAALRETRLGYRFILNKSFICAGGEPGKDTCKGDGGSPLVCPIPGTVDRYYQAGIVAWGIGCGEKGVPGVYANVAGFRKWIDEKLTQRSIPHNYYIDA